MTDEAQGLVKCVLLGSKPEHDLPNTANLQVCVLLNDNEYQHDLVVRAHVYFKV